MTGRRSVRGALALVLLGTALGGAWLGRPATTDAAASYTMDLYRDGAFASQETKERCVGGALQIVTNLMRSPMDTSVATQRRLWSLAAELHGPMEHVVGPVGEARALTTLGFGRYEVRVYRSRAAALAASVAAIRRTERPAILLVWWGAHSWVLHGFRATADPLLHPGAKITGYYISDPWYPRVSSIWGRSNPPDTLDSPALLAHSYIAWTRPDGRYPGWDGNWLVVEPIAPDGHWWRFA